MAAKSIFTLVCGFSLCFCFGLRFFSPPTASESHTLHKQHQISVYLMASCVLIVHLLSGEGQRAVTPSCSSGFSTPLLTLRSQRLICMLRVGYDRLCDCRVHAVRRCQALYVGHLRGSSGASFKTSGGLNSNRSDCVLSWIELKQTFSFRRPM